MDINQPFELGTALSMDSNDMMASINYELAKVAATIHKPLADACYKHHCGYHYVHNWAVAPYGGGRLVFALVELNVHQNQVDVQGRKNVSNYTAICQLAENHKAGLELPPATIEYGPEGFTCDGSPEHWLPIAAAKVLSLNTYRAWLIIKDDNYDYVWQARF